MSRKEVQVGQPTGRGRPRSERARCAVLHAVDDLLVEQGYAEMTVKGIAERAGVGRQTVYRWWGSKAEILLEACIQDAAQELSVPPSGDARAELVGYLAALDRFLRTPPGLGYLALLGEAQHDAQVRALVRSADVLRPTVRTVLRRLRAAGALRSTVQLNLAGLQLIGPVLYAAQATERPVGAAARARHVDDLLAAWSPG